MFERDDVMMLKDASHFVFHYLSLLYMQHWNETQ